MFFCFYFCDALLLLHPERCDPPIVVVVGGVWFGSTRLLLVHHGLNCYHVGCTIPAQKTTRRE